jgi:hypothetical protein
LRCGNLTDAVLIFFRTLARPLPSRTDGLLPTLLKVTNADCHIVNTDQLKKLRRETVHFKCEDGSQRSVDDPCSTQTNERHSRACAAFWDLCTAEPDIEFAVGAQVIVGVCIQPRLTVWCLTNAS